MKAQKEKKLSDSIVSIQKTSKGFYRILINDSIGYKELDQLHDYAKNYFGEKNYVIRRVDNRFPEIYRKTV